MGRHKERPVCVFNNHVKKRIKQIFQDLQHPHWVGGADSSNGWLTQLRGDTVTMFLFAEENWHHETCQHTHLFWGLSHVCPTHTPDKQRSRTVFGCTMSTARLTAKLALQSLFCLTFKCNYATSISTKQTNKQTKKSELQRLVDSSCGPGVKHAKIIYKTMLLLCWPLHNDSSLLSIFAIEFVKVCMKITLKYHPYRFIKFHWCFTCEQTWCEVCHYFFPCSCYDHLHGISMKMTLQLEQK